LASDEARELRGQVAAHAAIVADRCPRNICHLAEDNQLDAPAWPGSRRRLAQHRADLGDDAFRIGDPCDALRRATTSPICASRSRTLSRPARAAWLSPPSGCPSVF
jgi:hypothetical protein